MKKKNKKPFMYAFWLKIYIGLVSFLSIIYFGRLLLTMIKDKNLLIALAVCFGMFLIILFDYGYSKLKKEYYEKKDN